MASDYSDIKKVRELNGQEFIDSFRNISRFIVFTKSGSFTVRKQDVWISAKARKINYAVYQGTYKFMEIL